MDIRNVFLISCEQGRLRASYDDVHFRGSIVDMLVPMALDVFGPLFSVTTTGQKVTVEECLNSVNGAIVANLLHYK